MSRINEVDKRAAVFYLHPWEIDPEQPRLKAGLLSTFRHYTNLQLTEKRLRRLLEDFTFGPMTSVMLAETAVQGAPPAFAVPLPYLW
jgi:hypothetical protein